MQGQRSMVEADSLRMQARQWDTAFRRVLVDLGKLPASDSSASTAGDAAAPGGGNESAASGKTSGANEGQPRLTPELVLEMFQDLRIERAVMLRSQVCSCGCARCTTPRHRHYGVMTWCGSVSCA